MLRLLPLCAFAGFLLVFNSCEKHHPGEMPEVQKEHLHPLDAHHEEAHPEFPTPPVSGASATPTPADFFPKPTP
ncbi:MAG: hypothetical protein ACR2MW_04805 [Chthoniobacterales bacterium]